MNRLTKLRKSPTSSDDDFFFYTYDHRNRLTTVEFRDTNSPTSTLIHLVEYGNDSFDRRNYIMGY